MVPVSQLNQVTNALVPETVTFLQVPVHRVTMAVTLALINGFMDEPGVHQVATVNPEFVMTAQEDHNFMAVLRAADLCIPDGIGLLLAGWLKGRRLPARVAGSDLVYLLAEEAARRGWRLFLLGAAPGIAEEAREILVRRYPGLVVCGTHSGSPDPAEDQGIVTLINESQADLLYVAYGAPNQDKWIFRNRNKLDTVRVAIGIGGSLDFISGRVRRAPRWLQRLGLEWLYRLLKEPWRWRRMLALPRFIYLVIKAG